MRRANRWRILALIFALSAGGASAQLGPEIARRHAERAGDRLAELKAIRAEGRTFIAGEVVPFTMIAERPNRLRVESFSPLRRVLQVYDGVNPPWLSHTEARGGTPQDMNEGDARDFIANADFDGPLVGFAEKGFSVDYAGEDTLNGRRAYKLLVMNKRDEIFFLWVDTENHEIVKRLVYRSAKGQRVAIETWFKDFREVAGTRQPHRIETSGNGELLYVMLIDRMFPNPEIPADTFARP